MNKKPEAPAILKGPTGGTNVMRGRDVEFLLRNRDIDPNLVTVLTRIAEINHTNTLAVAELATMFDNMITTMQGITEVAGNMKAALEQFKRGAEGEVEGEIPNHRTEH